MLKYIHKEGKAPLIKILSVLLVINITLFFCLPDTLFTVIVFGISLVLFAMALNFYKRPHRVYKGDLHGLVNAPTDGKVVVIEKVFEKEFFNEERIQVSIFMSFFNAYSNWVPVSGKSRTLPRGSGTPGLTSQNRVSENEHTNIVIETPEHGTILTKQIAEPSPGGLSPTLKKRKRFILAPVRFIKLGSRMDIYLPVDSEILVDLGEEVRANVTFLARLSQVKR